MTRQTPPRVATDTPIGRDVDLDTENVRLPDGTRCTTERADEIVAEVRRRVGRPSLTDKAEHSPQIAFRVPPAVRERAAAVAASEGKTVSQLAREALEARLRAS